MTTALAEFNSNQTIDGESDSANAVLTSDQFDVFKHNAMITITSGTTGKHRTFWIRTEKRGKLKGLRLVRLLTGPDRSPNGDWKAFAEVEKDRIRVWKTFRDERQEKIYSGGNSWEQFAKMLVEVKMFEAKGCKYQVCGFCRRCNRLLSTPASISSGIGPVCGNRG